MLAPGKSLIGCQDDEGVFVLAGFFQGSDDFADAIIERANGLVHLAHPVGQRLFSVGGDAAFCFSTDENRLSGGPLYPLLDKPRVGRFSGPRWINVCRISDLDVSV